MSDHACPRLFNVPFATTCLVVFGAMDLLWLARFGWDQAVEDIVIATAAGFFWESMKS